MRYTRLASCAGRGRERKDRTIDPPRFRVDAHFFWIDCMVRNRYGRAALAPNLVRWYEARMGAA